MIDQNFKVSTEFIYTFYSNTFSPSLYFKININPISKLFELLVVSFVASV